MRAQQGSRVRTVAALAWALSILVVLAGCPAEGPSPDGEAAAVPEPAAEPAAEPAPAAPPPPDLHHGIDASHHTGAIDWGQVAAAGHTFAIVKATEGVDNPDASFHLHWPALKEAGLVRGAYHFYVTEDDPAEQARFFLDRVELEPGDLVPVVDLELIGHGTEPGLVDRVEVFLETVEAEIGAKPIIYTSPNFWDRHMSDRFGGYPLWIAEYGVDEPRLPRGWEHWHLWQWRDDAAVPGVEKGVDLSRVNRSGVDLSSLLVPRRPQPGAPQPGAP